MSQDLAAKEIRYTWLRSQMRWHQRRALDSKWHINQYRWYRRESRRVFTFTDVVVRTFLKNKELLSKNISQNSTLLQALLRP